MRRRAVTFVVNPEKKRTWNHGWWRDWTQGKVLIGVSVTAMAALVVTVAHLLLTVDFARAFSFDDGRAQSDAMVALFAHLALASLFLAYLRELGVTERGPRSTKWDV